MTIQFIMPGWSDGPVGGYLTVYSLGAELLRRGHRVRVIMPLKFLPTPGWKGLLLDTLRTARLRRVSRGGVNWYPLDPGLKIVVVKDLRKKWLPGADATVATMYATAPIVHGYSQRQGRKLYYVQGHEVWAGPRAEVHATYRLPLHKVTVSTWLAEIVVAEDGPERHTFIPYGLDHHVLKCTRPFWERTKRITLLYSTDPIKGAWDGVTALEIVRRFHPDLSATLFGGPARHPYLPDWIEYRQRPSRAELGALLNDTRLFLHTSWNEGFGLPPAEAMACGCPVVATRSGGPADYVHEGITGFFAEPRNPQALAQSILAALDDPRLPAISEAAVREVARYRWDTAAEAWLRILGAGR